MFTKRTFQTAGAVVVILIVARFVVDRVPPLAPLRGVI